MKYTINNIKSRRLNHIQRVDKYYKFAGYRFAVRMGRHTFGEWIGKNTTVRDVFGYCKY